MISVVVLTIAVMMIIVQLDKVEASIKTKSIRNHIQKQMQKDQDVSNEYTWIGSAPWCHGSCSDCYALSRSCLTLVRFEEDIPSEYKNKAEFGSGCWTGNKVLCGPTITKTSDFFWIGTAPFCNGKCKDCHDKGYDCYALANADYDMATEYRDKANFGKSCDSGYKALCGPLSEERPYYWVGKPMCEEDCDICYESGVGCLALYSSANDIPQELKNKAPFGKTCFSGLKPLCGPKNEDTGNYWVGGGFNCKGSCDDCTKNGATCLTTASDRAGIPAQYVKDSYKFGSTCKTGQKALCRKIWNY